MNRRQAFFHQSLDQKGAIKQGHLFSTSKEAALKTLNMEGLSPYTLRKKRSLPFKLEQTKEETLIAFCDALANYLSAGFSISDALKAYYKTLPFETPFAIVLEEAIKQVETGETLHQSLKLHPKYFDSFFITMIATGEKSNALIFIFEHLKDYLKWVHTSQKNLKRAISYPLTLFFIIVAVFITLTVFLVPEMTKLYSIQKIPFPKSTEILLAISAFFSSKEAFYLPLFILIFMLLLKTIAKYNPSLEIWLHKKLFAIPLLGSFVQKKHASLFFLLLSRMTKSHVPLEEALSFMGTYQKNKYVRSLFKEALKEFLATGSLAPALYATKFFDAPTYSFLENGEATHTLPEAFDHLAALQQKKFMESAQKLHERLPHLMIVIAGLLVLWMVFSLFLPVYDQTINTLMN